MTIQSEISRTEAWLAVERAKERQRFMTQFDRMLKTIQSMPLTLDAKISLLADAKAVREQSEKL